LKRDVASERVADDVRGLEGLIVQRALDGVGEHGFCDPFFDRRPTRVSGQGQRQHVVTAFERG
jgi:hypothetical protein